MGGFGTAPLTTGGGSGDLPIGEIGGEGGDASIVTSEDARDESDSVSDSAADAVPVGSPPVVGTPRHSYLDAPSQYNTTIPITQSERRCLRAINLTEHRLETIAMLDYKGIYNAGGGLAPAGQLFDQRIIERAADLEAVITTFANLTETQPDELAAAIAQYDSALVATDTDFGLLKILRLLYEYALRSCRFSSFQDEYTLPDYPNFSLESLGYDDGSGDASISELLRRISGIPDNWTEEQLAPGATDGTIKLVQAIISLNFATQGLSPYRVLPGGYTAMDETASPYLYSSNSPPTPFLTKMELHGYEGVNYYRVASVSRDLLFSSQMVRLRKGDDFDDEYKALIEERLGTNFINSATATGTGLSLYYILHAFTGLTYGSYLINSYPYSSTVTQYRKFSAVVNSTKESLVGSLINWDGTSAPKQLFAEDSDTVQQNSTSGTTSYTTIAPIVEDAFMGDDVLNFENFDTHVGNLVTQLKATELFGKVSFGLLDGKDALPSQTSQVSRASNAPPASMTALTAQMIDLLNRKFFDPFLSVAKSEFTEWFTPEHIGYNKLIAWILIRDNPAMATQILQAFLDDVDAGWLTADSLPEVIDEDTADALIEDPEEGTERVESILHVLPGTSTAVELTGKRPALNTALGNLYRYYKNRGTESVVSTRKAGEARANWPPIGASGYMIDTNTQAMFATSPGYIAPGYEGSALPPDPPTDLRAQNVMAIDRNNIRAVGSEASAGTFYLGIKLIACEIIDAFLSLMRDVMEPWTSVTAVSDSDPVFPTLRVLASPYGGGSKWDMNEPGYEAFQMSTWVPTVLAWRDTFTRTSSHTTYFRGKSMRSHASHIIYALSQMLEPTANLVRTEVGQGAQLDDESVLVASGYVQGEDQASLYDDYWYYPICVSLRGVLNATSCLDESYDAYFDAATYRLEQLLGTDSPITTETEWEPSASSDAFYDSYDHVWTGTVTTQSNLLITVIQDFVLMAQEEGNILGLLYDFLGRYGDRIENYQNAITDLIENESTPLGEFIANLEELGDAGVDILQNLTPSQFALKQVALEEEKADTGNAYLPMLSIINSAEQEAVKYLSSVPNALVPESSTTKVIFVGVPTGTFDTFKSKLNANAGSVDNSASIDTTIDEEQRFNIRVTYIDSEYPQITFRAKSYAFRNDVYILPEGIHSTGTVWDQVIEADTFEDIYKFTTFSQLNMRVEESQDNSADISIDDEVRNYTRSDLPDYDDPNADSLVNLLASETLKIYYRMMLGVNFSETVFPTSPDSMSIPIGDYASGLATSMAETVSELSTTLPDLSENIEEILGDLSQLSDPDSFVSGELTAVDSALLETLRDAYQTRLFSADELRSRVLSAKVFDRILAIPIDPDEFYIVAPGEAELPEAPHIGAPATPQKIFDYYLDAGIIIETGEPSPKNYKLAPRTTAEGSMAFGRVTVALEPYAEGKDRIFDL